MKTKTLVSEEFYCLCERFPERRNMALLSSPKEEHVVSLIMIKTGSVSISRSNITDTISSLFPELFH